jgi:hypothetical protein
LTGVFDYQSKQIQVHVICKYAIMVPQGEDVSSKRYLSTMLTVGALAALAVVVSMFATNPTAVGPIGVTVWFIVLFVTLQAFVAAGLYKAKTRGDQPGLQVAKLQAAAWRQGMLVALGVVIFLGLSSLRQLSLRDVVIICALLVLGEFYFRTRA